MDMILRSGDALIWVTSLFAALGMFGVGFRWIIQRLDIENQNRLLGSWYGYGYFHNENSEQFYREKIFISRKLTNPFRLSMVATPCSHGDPPPYKGWVVKNGDYVYSSTKENGGDDVCFEIGVLRISSQDNHVRDSVVGLHLGQSYIPTIHLANAFVWTRDFLDASANEKSAQPTQKESEQFRAICDRYFEYKNEVFELLLRYREPAHPL